MAKLAEARIIFGVYFVFRAEARMNMLLLNSVAKDLSYPSWKKILGSSKRSLGVRIKR